MTTLGCGTFVSPAPLNAPKWEVEKYAQEVASVFNFAPGDNIALLASRLGGHIVTGSTGHEDTESGSLIAREANDFTIYVSPFTSLERDRFTIAHELGHLLMHLPYIKKSNPSAVMRATRYVDEMNSDSRRAEWEANWFAAALLMPAEQFRAAAQKGVENLKSIFRVSEPAIRARAQSLGIPL